ncbi:putative MFS family arabinose efflux permease [Pedobacter cryoconitis]|uniref:Putative MFS family arabinose efflux permease n=1 Tax=Pedobacter cryoconitis TaxID=188932 RepID=A0A7W8ZPC3_9SPHI|nr:MFS transporter [Pedobacter cryoconitis]MBB5637722.1 putative MFS family arabinose efflux permease [Pedobacter cryoconitis]MBB6270521.1 putative MFS family arabinose efflux permease [Pedobacter cryoconitis]
MTSEKPNLHPAIIPLMAVSAGVIVANIYYNQPILNEIGQSLHVSESQIGRISMLSQLGYGLGMFFLLPLGDKLNRKNLILLLCGLLILTLVLFAYSSSLTVICLLSFLVGLFSTPAQIILPMAATLGKENRGKNVGKVFSGILVGILGARVLSGLITEWLGWRYVYGISAFMVLTMSILLKLYLPEVTPRFKGSYLSLLKSTLALVKEYRVLRQAALLGAFTFGVFCSFWTTLTFHLSSPPLNYHTGTIGLFGLIAIGGALVAPYFGKLADKGNVYGSLLLTVSMIIGSIILIKIFPYSIPVLIVSVFFLDIGVQATQITNFTRIYSLHEDAHSRLNTIYMTTYFIGAAVGTFFGLLSWKLGQWSLSTSQMLLWSCIALLIVMVSKRYKS